VSDTTSAALKGQRFLPVVIAYVLALAAAAASMAMLADWLDGSLLWLAAVGDLVATLVVFGFSAAYRNSSFYDPYWSVVPPVLLAYWILAAGLPIDLRSVLLAGLVGWWALRLTHNWARGWHGLGDEDWRYRQLQAQLGVAYWPVSLLGIHLMPTVWVFLGCLGLYLASGAAEVDGLAAASRAPLGWMDGVAALVTAAAVWLERRADLELLKFREQRTSASELLRTGVWAWCRHPNYLGEIGFWVGVCLFGVAANPSAWWVWLGPAVMIALFAGVTISMIERKLAAAKPGYASYQAAVPRLVPLFRRRWPGG
jgi:steroid 5-alpha reductase family enzyme